MTTYSSASDEQFRSLSGKTVLIIGAATGIGRAAVDVALKHNANLVVGDWAEHDLPSLLDTFPERMIFKKCDVSNWDHVLDLFAAGYSHFNAIDCVLSNAGVDGGEDLLDARCDDKGKLLPPSLSTLNVNLVGQIHVVKCALFFFAKSPQTRSQLILTSSSGAFFPASILPTYCAAKAGVLTLMRSLRSALPARNVTINVVAPWMTDTPMVKRDWLARWKLPLNSAEGVARVLFLPVVKPDINGKAFFVAGDKAVELEDSLHDAEPLWMGDDLCRNVREAQNIDLN